MDVETDIPFDALVADAEGYFRPGGEADAASGLRDCLRLLATFLTATDAGAVWRALAGQAQHDPEVAACFDARGHRPQRQRDRAPFARAVARGEPAAGTDIDLAVDRGRRAGLLPGAGHPAAGRAGLHRRARAPLAGRSRAVAMLAA